MRNLPEADWKYMRRISDELLETLSRRINQQVQEILNRKDLSEYEKRGEIYGTVLDQNKVVANCFDNWSRSRFYERCGYLVHHGLLLREHMENLTPETQAALRLYCRLEEDEEDDEN